MYSVKDIRQLFVNKLNSKDFVIDKSGVKTVEIVGVQFKADEDLIFGEINKDYVERELEWYKSQSRYVKDIPGKTPVIWEQVSSTDGKINSNYGWAIWSTDNYSQYDNVLKELKSNPDTRRAIMIYTRPSMHYDYNIDGMSDFMCTNTVQYLIRDNKLVSIISMRSNDAWAGFRNDLAWQKYVSEKLANDLDIETGDIIWQAGSLHLYERQFYLIDNYFKTGNLHIKKSDYIGEF